MTENIEEWVKHNVHVCTRTQQDKWSICRCLQTKSDSLRRSYLMSDDDAVESVVIQIMNNDS